MVKTKPGKCPRCGYLLPQKDMLRCPRCNTSIAEKCADCSGCGPVLWGKKEDCKKDEK